MRVLTPIDTPVVLYVSGKVSEIRQYLQDSKEKPSAVNGREERKISLSKH